MGNNLIFSMAVEKLVDLDAAARRALRDPGIATGGFAPGLIGTRSRDLAAMSVFLYAMREREMILNVLRWSPARRMTTYSRPGGLWRDVPDGFDPAVREILEVLPRRIDEYESMLTKNELFLDRTRKIGVISTDQCKQYGLTGPVIRATGLAYDLRKARPYNGYEQYDFHVPTQTGGDVYARYLVRVEEMRKSLAIDRQALDKLPGGPVSSTTASSCLRRARKLA